MGHAWGGYDWAGRTTTPKFASHHHHAGSYSRKSTGSISPAEARLSSRCGSVCWVSSSREGLGYNHQHCCYYQHHQLLKPPTKLLQALSEQYSSSKSTPYTGSSSSSQIAKNNQTLIMNYGMDYQGDAGGGGGFQTYGDGGGGTSQSPQNQKTRRQYDEQTLVPVTIKMALGARPDGNDGEGSLALEDGRKISSVKIVGAVRGCNDFSTNVMFEIEDGTGLLDVKQWFDDNDCTFLQELKAQTLKENIYVKIIGQIKVYDNKMTLVANSVRPLSSGDELTHHMLSVVHSSEKSKRMSEIVSNSSASMMQLGSPAPVGGGVGFGMQSHGSPMAAETTSGDGGLKGDVMRWISQNIQGDHGADVQKCIQVMPHYPENEIRQAVADLCSEGHLFSTIDEDHVGCTGTNP